MTKHAKAAWLAALILAPGLAWSRPVVHLDAGYTRLNLEAYKSNKYNTISDLQNSNVKAGGPDGYDANYGGLGLDFPIADLFTAGFSLAYIASSAPDKFSYRIDSLYYSYTNETDFSLIPIMAVVGFSPVVEKGFHYGARLGLGYGLASASSRSKIDDVSSSSKIDVTYAAQGLVAELGGRAGYEWRRFRLAADLAYRYASFDKMTVVSTSNSAVVKTGDTYEDKNKKAIPIDLGGIQLGLSVGYKF